MEHFWEWNSHLFNPFVFVLAIILITSFFSWLRESSRQQTIREALKKGVPLDKEALKSIGSREDEDGGGNGVGGIILVAVAAGLAVLGYQIQKVEGDEHVFGIMLGVASIPLFIGIALLITTLFRKKNKDEG